MSDLVAANARRKKGAAKAAEWTAIGVGSPFPIQQGRASQILKFCPAILSFSSLPAIATLGIKLRKVFRGGGSANASTKLAAVSVGLFAAGLVLQPIGKHGTKQL